MPKLNIPRLLAKEIPKRLLAKGISQNMLFAKEIPRTIKGCSLKKLKEIPQRLLFKGMPQRCDGVKCGSDGLNRHTNYPILEIVTCLS